jgi:integrative and conjugative element protein (TIGR02256 family)
VRTNKKTIIWISNTDLNILKEDLHKWDPYETGGVLMGYWNMNQAVITEIIDGGPDATRTKTSFNPDHDYQLEEISRIYFLSGRTETYLGDWHTHPGGSAYLSERDKKTLSKIAEFKKTGQPKPLMMVFGTKPAEIRVWYARQTLLRKSLVELNYKVFD